VLHLSVTHTCAANSPPRWLHKVRHLRWTERHKWCYTACNTRWVLWRRPQNPATTKLSQLRCGRDLGTAAGEPSVENTSPVALMCHRNVFSKESGGHTILTPGVNIVFRPPDSSPSFIAATDIAARRSAISWRQENDGGLCPLSGGRSRLRRYRPPQSGHNPSELVRLPA
jgi:hypothetical protein